jgi:hypothetical protein
MRSVLRSTATSLVLMALIVVSQAVPTRPAFAGPSGPTAHDRAAFLAAIRKADEASSNLGRVPTRDSATLLRMGLAACTALRRRRLEAYLDSLNSGPDMTGYREVLSVTLIAGRSLCPQYSQRSVFTRALPAVEKRQNADGRLACVTAFNFLGADNPNSQNPLSGQDVANGLHGSSVVATMAANRYQRWVPLVGILSDMANEWRAGTSASMAVRADILAAAELCRPFTADYK